MKQQKYIEEGTHVIVDIKNVHNFLLENTETIEYIMCEAARLSGANILNIVKHKFEPVGFTCVLLLSESHMSIHTYVDEDNLVSGMGSCYIDFYQCGSGNPLIGVNYLIDRLCSEESVVSMKVLKRGLDVGIVEINNNIGSDVLCKWEREITGL